jgi:uncharacterized membrane protein
MKRYFFLTIISLFVISSLLLPYSCKHDPEFIGITEPVDTTGNGNNTGTQCSPDTVYFVQQVLPMFQSSCAMSGCHDAGSHEEDIVLDSYQTIMATGGIKVNNPTDSKIYKQMLKTGEDQMPPSPASPMTTAQLNLISKWIGQGAKNNSCILSGCDTTNVKYSTHIKPLIQNSCQGCHSGAAPGGGINLATYAGVKAIADNGAFVGAISHLTGYSAMPKNGNKLTDCQINMVNIWINQGSPEN